MTDNTKLELNEIIDSIRAYSNQKLDNMNEEQKKKIASNPQLSSNTRLRVDL